MSMWTVEVSYTRGCPTTHRNVIAPDPATAIQQTLHSFRHSCPSLVDLVASVKASPETLTMSARTLTTLFNATDTEDATFRWGGQDYIFQAADRASGDGKTFNVRAKNATGKDVVLFVRIS